MDATNTGSTSRLNVSETNICKPIRTLAEFWYFASRLPSWIRRIKEIKARSPTVVSNKHTACHHAEGSSIILPSRLDAGLVPRTLICHDMKNGYLEDRYVDPVKIGNGYTFFRWPQIDMFVYFSHHFITIPPLAWINVAHSNGVKILGTFITEWDEGRKICNEFLKDVETMKRFVDVLVDLTVSFKLDGWLLNIENSLESTAPLVAFVKYLTVETHKRRAGSKIIWYDSVTSDGNLHWQNELNSKNKAFFDVCDGIFLNYTWTEANLLSSIKVAQYRVTDVYVGIDVFGRNTFGGGKFQSKLAAEKIRKLNMSMAIFAQGWTHESLSKSPIDNFMERFVNRDNAFWAHLWPFLYTHPINECFETVFYIGTDKEYFKLAQQEPQLSRIPRSNVDQASECGCLQMHADAIKTGRLACVLTRTADIHHHHLFYCDINIEGDAILYSWTKRVETEKNDFLNLGLLIQENGSFRRMVCCAVRTRKKASTFSVEYVHPSPDNRNLRFSDEFVVPADRILRCYHLKFKSRTRILEITGQILNANSVILHGIGIKNIRSI